MTTPSINNILVGVDFSDCSKVALAQAARLAKAHGATLHVVHVIEQLVLRDLQEVLKKPAQQVEEQVRQDSLRDLEKLIADFKSEQEVQLDVSIGPMLHEIIRKVKDTAAGLLVLGTRGGTSPASGTGTLALKSVRKAPTMVLLVRPEHAEPFKKVVVCIDFSDISPRLIEQAAHIARLDNGELRLIHVYGPPWKKVHYMAPTPEASVYFQREYKHALQSRLEGHVNDIPEELRGGLQIHCELVENSSYGYGIIDYVNDNQADLVVLGNKGRTNLRYIFLGSTAERVVQNAPCSILAVKPADYSVDIKN